MTARMGIFQEQIYARFGKHPREALFYNVSDVLFEITCIRILHKFELGERGGSVVERGTRE